MTQHTQIHIITLDKQKKLVTTDSVRVTAVNKDLRQKPEPVIQVYPGVPPYGTPEFFEFARKLNESLNR